MTYDSGSVGVQGLPLPLLRRKEPLLDRDGFNVSLRLALRPKKPSQNAPHPWFGWYDSFSFPLL
jgi:hypothetical protein